MKPQRRCVCPPGGSPVENSAPPVCPPLPSFEFECVAGEKSNPRNPLVARVMAGEPPALSWREDTLQKDASPGCRQFPQPLQTVSEPLFRFRLPHLHIVVQPIVIQFQLLRDLFHQRGVQMGNAPFGLISLPVPIFAGRWSRIPDFEAAASWCVTVAPAIADDDALAIRRQPQHLRGLFWLRYVTSVC